MESEVNLIMEQHCKESSLELELNHLINSPILLFSKITPCFLYITPERKEIDLSNTLEAEGVEERIFQNYLQIYG